MAVALDQGGEFVWPEHLAVFDPARWPEGRAAFHLARCAAAPTKWLKYQEICHGSQRVWLHDPARYRALGFV